MTVSLSPNKFSRILAFIFSCTCWYKMLLNANEKLFPCITINCYFLCCFNTLILLIISSIELPFWIFFLIFSSFSVLSSNLSLDLSNFNFSNSNTSIFGFASFDSGRLSVTVLVPVFYHLSEYKNLRLKDIIYLLKRI